MPEAQIWCSAAVLASAQSSPNDDLTDDPMDLVVYHVSRVLSFTVQLVVLLSIVYELRQYNTVSTLGMDVKPPNLGPSPAARISSCILTMSTVLNTCSRSQYRSYVTVFRYIPLPCRWRL